MRTTATVSMLACGLLGFAARVHAADNGVYAGISLGSSQFDVQDSTVVRTDDNDTGFKILLGLRPLDWVGVEINYVNLGQARGDAGGFPFSDFRSDQSGVDVMGLLFLDAGPVDLFAKGGLIRWDADTRFNSPLFGSIRVSDNGTDAVFGAGAQVRLGSFAARLEYEHFDIDTDGLADKPDLISLGLTYTFF